MSRPVSAASASELDFPGPQPIAVGASGIGGDQETLGGGEAVTSHLVPPAADGFDGELGGVGRVADVDPALVVGHVVDAIGDGLGVLAEGAIGEVVDVHPLGLAFGCPLGTAVGVVADQLLLLGVDRDHRLAVVDEGGGHVVEVVELGVAVGVLATLGHLGVGLERVAEAVQQAQYRTRARRRSPGAPDPQPAWSTTSTSSAASTSGCPGSRGTRAHRAHRAGRAGASVSDLSPPPGARSRAEGSMPAATSASALITVLRLIPEAVATAVLPPRPSISAVGTGDDPALHLVHMRQDHLEESREPLLGDLHTRQDTTRVLIWRGPLDESRNRPVPDKDKQHRQKSDHAIELPESDLDNQ